MVIFKDETQNFANFTYFEKIIFIQQWLTQNMWYIEKITCIFNNKLKKKSLKKIIWKSEKD
jgi:hypothetical protein